MKPKLLSFFLMINVILLFTGCGPSAEELKNREALFADSVKKATEESTLKKINDEQAAKELEEKKRKEATERENDLIYVKNRISDLEAELEVQKMKLEDIKKPVFLRTPQEKEQQVRDQVKRISGIEEDISNNKILLKKIKEGANYGRYWSENTNDSLIMRGY